MTTMHFFQSHSGLHRTVCLHQFPDLGSYKYTFLDFCVTQIWEFIPHIFEPTAGFIHTFTKFFMRPSFMCKGGRKIFSGRTRGGITTFFSPGVSDVRLDHSFLHSDSSCPGCPTHTGNSSILCTRVAFPVTVLQP